MAKSTTSHRKMTSTVSIVMEGLLANTNESRGAGVAQHRAGAKLWMLALDRPEVSWRSARLHISRQAYWPPLDHSPSRGVVAVAWPDCERSGARSSVPQ